MKWIGDLLSFWILTMGLLFSIGCTRTLPVKPMDTRPLLESVPVRAGIHYPQSLEQAVYSRKPSGSLYTLRFRVGEASMQILEQVFNRAFPNAVNIEEPPLLGQSIPDVDVIIEPILEDFSIQYKTVQKAAPWWTTKRKISDTTVATIEYKVRIYSSEGKPLRSHRITGVGRANIGTETLFTSEERSEAIASEQAIRNAAAKLSVALAADGEIARQLPSSLSIAAVSAKTEPSAAELSSTRVAFLRHPADKVSTEFNVTDCVINKLTHTNPSVKAMTEEEFRENMFPWFESATLPRSSDEIASLLTRAAVRKKMNALNIGYLAVIEGGTISDRLTTYLGEVKTQQRESHIVATVFDVAQGKIANVAEAKATGMSWAAGGLLPPVWYTAEPIETACEALAKKLAAILPSTIPDA